MNRRHLTVKLNLRGRDLSSFLAEAHDKIEKTVKFDATKYELEWGGQFENQQRAQKRLAFIVPGVVALIFVLLYSSFGTVRHAALILTIVPVALLGGLIGLNLRGMTLNVSSAVGFIALFGVAVQNGVIMVASLNHQRRTAEGSSSGGDDGRDATSAPGAHDGDGRGARPVARGSGARSWQRRAASTGDGDCGRTDHGNFAHTVRSAVALSVAGAASGEEASGNSGGLGECLMILFRRVACLFLPGILLLPDCSWPRKLQRARAIATPPAADDARPHIALNDYLSEVLRSNLDLSAQRANIAISQAGVTTATVTPDWSVDIGFPTVDLSNQGNPTNFSAGLNVPIELGGKRGSRVRAAKADVATANSDYEDAVRQLRATATGAFIDALGARAILVSKNKSLGQLDRIVTVNQERVARRRNRRNRTRCNRASIAISSKPTSSPPRPTSTAPTSCWASSSAKPERLATQLPVPDGTLEIPIRALSMSINWLRRLWSGALM